LLGNEDLMGTQRKGKPNKERERQGRKNREDFLRA
jgi:hypothetical protein